MVSAQFATHDLYMYVCIYAAFSLLWVAALGLVVIYCYSVGTFAFLPNEFHDPSADAENVLFCHSLIQCFITVLEHGLLGTLGSVSCRSLLYAYFSTMYM